METQDCFCHRDFKLGYIFIMGLKSSFTIRLLLDTTPSKVHVLVHILVYEKSHQI